ncbi:MAG: radical SAM protein [Candidatus Omnitrophica bacterium]|nr:radical SAM protein [Candidatus Omnitrophota bacterium]
MRSKKNFKYIYGPVSSWRLGSSLGVDPISQDKKVCGFDCVYCQIGRLPADASKRRCFVRTGQIIKEIKQLPDAHIDYITFSGKGEPTMAKNLGALIQGVKKIRREPVAVITNASLLNDRQVRKDLSQADFVMAKLDACSRELFEKVNHPDVSIGFEKILQGIKKFSKGFKGRFALQIMFVKENKGYAGEIALLAKEIMPDEVQINTPLRKSKAKPLSRKTIRQIKKFFKPMRVVCVYEGKKVKAPMLDIRSTLKRRGKVE